LTDTRRKALLLALLVLTVAAALWPLPEEQIAVRNKTPAKSPLGATGMALPEGQKTNAAAGQNGEARAGITDLFPAQTWAPPIAIATKPAEPEPPPFPWVFGGRYQEEGKSMVFMIAGNEMYALKEGDSLPGGWKLTEIGPNALQFSYAPLNATRSLPMSELRP